MSDRIIRAGFTSYAVSPGGVYRFYATVRGAGPGTPVEYWRSLVAAGFGRDVHLWPAGRPADWPVEDVPPLSSDEIVLRGEGTFQGGKLPTAIALPSGGSAVIWNLWNHGEAPRGVGVGQSFASSAGPTLPLGLVMLALLGLAATARKGDRR